MLLCFGINVYTQAPLITKYIPLNVHGTTQQVRAVLGKNDVNIYCVGSFRDSLVVGGMRLYSRGDADGFILCLSNSLQPLWLVPIGGPGLDAATCIAVTPTGNIAVGAYCGANTLGPTSYTVDNVTYSGRGEADVVTLLLDTAGTVLWSRNDGGEGADMVADIGVTADDEIITSGTFTSTARFGNTTLGHTGGLQHSFVQRLASDGNHEAATAIIAVPSVSSASSSTPTRLFVDGADIHLSFTYQGTVIAGLDTLERVPTSKRPQTFVTIDKQTFTIKSTDSIVVCSDESSAWYSPAEGFYSQSPDLCGGNLEPSTWRVLSNGSNSRISNGIMDVACATVQPNGTMVVAVGSYSDTLQFTMPNGPSTLLCPNNALDGVSVFFRGESASQIVLGASVRGAFHYVHAGSVNTVACAQAEGVLTGLQGSPTVTWDQQLVCILDNVPTGVFEDIADPSSFLVTDLITVFDLAGSVVSAQPLTLSQVRSLPTGMYLLRRPEGLSLCYVGFNSIAFAASSSTSR